MVYKKGGAAMEGIKLVALDMDGTLLDSRKNPPADFESWVLSHPEILTVLASGRQYETLRRQFPAIADRLGYIADNGSFVFLKGENIFADEMNRQGVLEAISAFEAIPGCHLVLCGVRGAYMRPSRPDVEANCAVYYKKLTKTDDLCAAAKSDAIGKIAVLVDDHRAEAVYGMLPVLHPDFKVMLSGSEWLDVSNATVGKGAGVEVLQKRLGISREESMAFGDYLNDCELLDAVTESYAMGNAHPELKARARYITDTNNHDGVMKILRQIYTIDTKQ